MNALDAGGRQSQRSIGETPIWRIGNYVGALLLFTSLACFAGELPDPDDTPGKTNPQVKQSTIDETICLSGYTKDIRPSSSYTTTLKKQQLKDKKYRDKTPGNYEEDHLIPLEVGGHPRDKSNLWPQPYFGTWHARKKDVLEHKLKRMVCDGEITLREAQRQIAEDWISAYKEHVGND